MSASLTYAIKFVADMESAVRFHSSQLGLRLRFQSPEWSEFDTGPTTLALHLASKENPPGSCQLGFNVEDIDAFCADLAKQGVKVLEPPKDLHGHRIAKLQGPDGAAFSVSGRQGKKE
jgi:predicted enzyme related to lactoylglutathione lyase